MQAALTARLFGSNEFVVVLLYLLSIKQHEYIYCTNKNTNSNWCAPEGRAVRGTVAGAAVGSSARVSLWVWRCSHTANAGRCVLSVLAS